MKLATANRTLAALLTVAGVALVAVSIGLLVRAKPMLASAHQFRPSPSQLTLQCRSAAARLGFGAKEKSGHLLISLAGSDVDRLEPAFDRASVLIAMCNGYTLASFCAGTECGPDAMFMSLRPSN